MERERERETVANLIFNAQCAGQAAHGSLMDKDLAMWAAAYWRMQGYLLKAQVKATENARRGAVGRGGAGKAKAEQG